jgi:cytochrome c553
MLSARTDLALTPGLLVLLVLPLRLSASESPAASSVEFFEKKVRPVLVEHCGKCHGMSGSKIKGGLRVDSRAALLRGGDTGPAIVPGQPEKSRLLEALRYRNPDLQMPPKGKLTDAVIADLSSWVSKGAVWPDEKAAATVVGTTFDLAKRKADHWAWRPVHRPAVPAVKNSDWPRSSVDNFILARLEEKGFAPTPPTDRRTLLRRVTFDLTGLPPKPEEICQFLADPAPDAYEKVVDRLLGSPAFGERWARHWLDLVRYADSRGHEFDYAIPNAWQYRDYVIRALNADVPYDEFVREHVAGDLLISPRKNPTDGFNESVLGTGFWLLGEEVHSPVDIRQDLADRLDNRIDVFSKTFLGLTVSCARCHDHKFDAISTKDYYALFGILEGASPRLVRFDSLERNKRVATDLALVRQNGQARIAEALTADASPAITRAACYLLGAREALTGDPAILKEVSTPATVHVSGDFSAAFRKRLESIAAARKIDANLLSEWTAAVIAANRDVTDPLYAWAKLVSVDSNADRLAAVTRSISDTLRHRGAIAADAVTKTSVIIDYATAGASNWISDEAAFGPGPDLPGVARVGGPEPGVRYAEEAAAVYDRAWDGISAKPGSEVEPGALGRTIRAGRVLRTPGFTLTTGKVYYRLRGACEAYVAVEGHQLIAGPLHGQIIKQIQAGDGLRWVAHDLMPYKGRRAHIEFAANPGSDFAISRVVQADAEPADPWSPAPELLALLAGASTVSVEGLAAEYEILLRSWTTATESNVSASKCEAAARARFANWLLRHPGLLTGHAIRDVAARLREEQAAIAAGLVKESRLALALLDGNGANERVFVRGSHKAPGEVVPRRFLEALVGSTSYAAQFGSGRQQLAADMTDPDRDPFLARVQVNRLWHHLFGRGLVASTDNFGVLGESPTHPELLDFLADQFVREGWSTKKTIRGLVLSATYRMDSRSDEAADTADPDDLLLHRMRLRRLEGEAIRDAILLVSGRLDSHRFGPAVPIHLTPFLDGRGRPASGPVDGNGRRSLYLAVRRNFLSPFLLCFDTPIPFSTVGRRTVSNVPAQALILLNDPFVHEQAEVWAKKILSSPFGPRERIEGMYVAAFGRLPDKTECDACLEFLRKQAESRGVTLDNTWPWADLAHSLINAKEFTFIR